MTVIVADIGATNARFSFFRHGKMADIYQFACADFKTPQTMIATFKNNYAPDASSIVLGVAGAVLDNKVCWTNRDWSLSAAEMKKRLSFRKVILKNDVEIQAMSLPLLTKRDYIVLQRGKGLVGPKVLLSVGTGVGVAYYVNEDSFATEYGQTLLSTGKTLEKMITPMPILSQFKNKKEHSEQKFYQNLARITANLALSLKPIGGIYLYGRMLDEKEIKKVKFVDHFVAHPTMKKLLKEFPVFLVKKENLAFVGLKELVKKYDLS